MVLLVPVSLLLLFLKFRFSSLGPREAAIRAFLVLFGLVYGATEVLSSFAGISYLSLAITWVIFVCSLGLIVYRAFRNGQVSFKESIRSLQTKVRADFNWLDRSILVVIGLILLITGVTALWSPPNNFDSMTYHMARVVHWIQNQSVRFYPTSIPRQNYSMPLAEFMIMHLQVLSRSDFYANLVQWSAFILLIILAGKIAETLGVSKRGQILSGLFVATLPIGILESTSTQNDILVAVFCMSFGYYLLRLIRTQTWSDATLAGIAFGLALYTKGTAYIYCAGIGVPLALGGVLAERKTLWMPLLYRLLVLVLVGLAMNTPFYLRNLNLYGQPLSSETERISVDRLSGKGLYANLVRNASVNFALPVPGINQKMTALVRDHLGDLADNPTVTFEGSVFQVEYLINEDQAGNLLQALLFLPVLYLLFSIYRRLEYQTLLWYGALMLSLLLYSLLLKWQPWGTRLQLAIFALAAPLFGMMVDRLRRSTVIALVVVLSLSAYSLPYLFLNSTRPLVPLFSKTSPLRSNKIKRFFSDHPDLYYSYAEIISPFYKDLSIFHTERVRLYFASQMDFYEDYQFIVGDLLARNPKTIGLATGSNDWEYPLWVLTGQHYGNHQIVFDYVGVRDRSSRLVPSGEELPLYVLATENADLSGFQVEDYRVLLDAPSLDLLEMTP